MSEPLIEAQTHLLSADEFEKLIELNDKYRTRFPTGDAIEDGLDKDAIELLGQNIKELCQIEPIHLFWDRDEIFHADRLKDVIVTRTPPFKLFMGWRRYEAIRQALRTDKEWKAKAKVLTKIYERSNLRNYLDVERKKFRRGSLKGKSKRIIQSAIDTLLLRIAQSSNAFFINTKPLDKLTCYERIYCDLKRLNPGSDHRQMLSYLGIQERDKAKYRTSLRFFNIVKQPRLFKAVAGRPNNPRLRILNLSTGERVGELFRGQTKELDQFLEHVRKYVDEIETKFKPRKAKAPYQWEQYNAQVVNDWANEFAVHGQALTRYDIVHFQDEDTPRIVYHSAQNRADSYHLKVSTRKGLGDQFILPAIRMRLANMKEEQVRLVIDTLYKLDRLTRNLYGWLGGITPHYRGNDLKQGTEIPLRGVEYDDSYLKFIRDYNLERYVNLKGLRDAVRRHVEGERSDYTTDPIPNGQLDDFNRNPESFRQQVVDWLTHANQEIDFRRPLEKRIKGRELIRLREAEETIALNLVDILDALKKYENGGKKSLLSSNGKRWSELSEKEQMRIIKKARPMAFLYQLEEYFAGLREQSVNAQMPSNWSQIISMTNGHNGKANGNGNGHNGNHKWDAKTDAFETAAKAKKKTAANNGNGSSKTTRH